MATSTTPRLSESELIAPCGMNCGVCYAFLRRRNKCAGCRADDRGKPKTRVACRIKTCEVRRSNGGDFCTSTGCAIFPCERLRRLDMRYRAKYGMSMIENLGEIESDGLPVFVRKERSRWSCPGCGAAICVHKASCLVCQRKWR